jgi:hypothetical protein
VVKKGFIICAFLFISQLVFSQDEYDVGYIITNSGDTIKGKVKDKKFSAGVANCDKISFMGADGKEINKTPYDIKQYCKKGVRFYRSLPVGLESKLKFAEVLEYGDVILFGYISNSFISTTSDILSKSEKDKNASKNIEYFLQKRRDPNSLMKVKPKNFQEKAPYFFENDDELMKKIEGNSLGYDDVRLIVKTHNENAEKK